MLWNKSATVYGMRDKRISPYLKAWIMQGNVCVVGLIGSGTERNIEAQWDAPFTNDTLGEMPGFQKFAGLIQSGAPNPIMEGRTSRVTLNSVNVWTGTEQTISLTLKFMAFSDAKQEVMLPVQALEEMASPEVMRTVPIDLAQGFSGIGGRVPDRVMVNIGRNAIFPNMVLESVSTPLDTEKDKGGNLVRATVSISLKPFQMLNKSEIGDTFDSQQLVKDE
jgi:hypothetical protein